ncbi:hypothetical protein [Kitasatospora sp. NPDC001547]|nr:hypothetical protein KitaXyl93_16960 [Kitasatospora sp. Xyl93]
MRDQLPAEDREVPDESLEAAGDGTASPVTAGAPVVEPVRQSTGSLTA